MVKLETPGDDKMKIWEIDFSQFWKSEPGTTQDFLVTSQLLLCDDHPCHFNMGVPTIKKPLGVGQHSLEIFDGGL